MFTQAIIQCNHKVKGKMEQLLDDLLLDDKAFWISSEASL